MKNLAQHNHGLEAENSNDVSSLSEDTVEVELTDDDIEDLESIEDDDDRDIKFVTDEFEIFDSKPKKYDFRSSKKLSKRIETDSLKVYLKEIGRTELLSAEEERELARLARGGNLEAKQKIAKANLRLVVSIAKKYLNKGMNMQDMIQEGNLGLLKAIDRFDPELGYRFSTYATWWIKQAITRALADKSRLIRLPVHMNELLLKVKKAVRKLNLQLGRPPTVSEIAKQLDVKKDKVQLVLSTSKKLFSLDAKVGTDYDSTFGDLLEDNVIPLPTESTARSLLKEDVEQLLEKLNPQEKSVIEMRYGFNDKKPMSLTKIGEAIGVSKERARQIELKSLRKLRNNKATSDMRSYIV